MSHAVFVLLLQRAENPAHADRAWARMSCWEPARVPSVMDDQGNEALRLTATGADPMELCTYDEAEVKRAAIAAGDARAARRWGSR